MQGGFVSCPEKSFYYNWLAQSITIGVRVWLFEALVALDLALVALGLGVDLTL